MSDNGFLAKCGTAWRFLLFESPVNGRWTFVRIGLWAKFQYVNVYSNLSLSSNPTSEKNILIKLSDLLIFVFNSFICIVIYLCIYSLHNFIIYVFHYFLRKCVRKKQLVFFSLLRKFSMSLRTGQTDITMVRCCAKYKPIFYRSVRSPAWAKHLFLGVI